MNDTADFDIEKLNRRNEERLQQLQQLESGEDGGEEGPDCLASDVTEHLAGSSRWAVPVGV